MLAKVFEDGRSQAVRIPKEYRFNCSEVIIDKIGDVVILIPKDKGQKQSSFSAAIKDVLANDL